MSEYRSLILELAEVIDRHLSHRHASRAKEEPRPPRSRGPSHWWIRLLVPNLGTIIVVVILLFTFPSLAAPLRAPGAVSTSVISYQGRLADADGNPITGKVNMEFRIYDVPTGGTPLWEEYWTGGNAVDVSDGLFNVMLGSINTTLADAIAGHDELYLGITVGTDSEMEPRVQLGSVPFAMRALTVPNGSITTEKLADGAVTLQKLDMPMLALLGYKTCRDCGSTVEDEVTGWVPVKGASADEIIEVTTTTQGGAVLVQMTASFTTDPPLGHFCGIEVRQGGQPIRFIHLDGSRALVSDYGCSGLWLFTNLPAGTYTFRAKGHIGGSGQIRWIRERQIVVYEFLQSQTP